MRAYTLIKIVFLCGTTICNGLPFSDSSGSDTGGSQPVDTGDQSRQLQIYASPSDYAATNAPQDSLGMSTDSDWTVSIDVRSGTHPPSNEMISLGAYPLDGTETERAGLSMNLNAQGAGSAGEMQDAGSISAGIIAIPEMFVSNGTVRVSYTATNQVLEIAYANASTNQFKPMITRDTGDWPAMKSSGFVILLDAEPADKDTAEGNAFLDNLTVSLGTSPTWNQNLLSEGPMSLSSNQVQTLTNAPGPASSSSP